MSNRDLPSGYLYTCALDNYHQTSVRNIFAFFALYREVLVAVHLKPQRSCSFGRSEKEENYEK